MIGQSSKRKPVALFIVWHISAFLFSLFNVCSPLFGVTDQASLGITLLAAALYFIPMLVVIYRQSKIISLKWLVVVTRVLIIFFSSVFAIFLIAALCIWLT